MTPPKEYLQQFTEPAGYLDFARVGPPSRAVVETSARLFERLASPGPTTLREAEGEDARARAVVARLCHTDPSHVVVQPHTSLGLFQAAFNAARGEVLVSAAEFPANTYPWARAEALGLLRVRHLPSGPVTPDVLAATVSQETSVVSVSAVDFRTGYRADLAALRDVVGDRLLVVDGIQGFGVADEPWDAADVLVAGGQKWLRAGHGTGFAVLSDRALERTQPVLSGWTGAQDATVYDDLIHPQATDAASWGLTHLNPVTTAALASALELVELAGVEVIVQAIEQRLLEFEQVLAAVGARVVSATSRRAGILAFELPGHAASDVGAALEAAGISATARGSHVRLSPHASTSAEAVDLLLAALGGVTRATVS